MKNSPRLKLDQAVPERFVVGAGHYQRISGTLSGIHAPQLKLEGAPEHDCSLELFEGQENGDVEFVFSILCLPEDVDRCVQLVIRVSDASGEVLRHELGEQILLAASPLHGQSAHTMGASPLIAICLASYNPDIKRLSRQIESILCQSYQNWILIIADDASTQLDWYEIEVLADLDPRRIRFYRHEQNLGFYLNFERALNYVPENAQLVALSDQDDVWYPEKLQVLVDELNADPRTSLVYSDMRIVEESGELIADSYWQNRRNEYQHLPTILLANTVTGAASMFRRELLDTALPFPQQPGDAYHDQWLACAALCTGKLSYVASPLYDYMQYSDSVLGHCDFRDDAGRDKTAKSLNSSDTGKWQMVYRQDCLRLQVVANTLWQRTGARSAAHLRRLTQGGWMSALRLVINYLSGRLRGRTTNAAELWLAAGFVRGKGRKTSCR